jgi:hypothetical protein
MADAPEALLGKVRAALASARQASAAYARDDGTNADHLEAVLADRLSALDEVCELIPEPPRSMLDVLSHAEHESQLKKWDSREGNVADALLHFAADIELGAARAKATAIEIVALIDTRPQSPRLDEIEAIIAKAYPLSAPRSPLHVAIDGAGKCLLEIDAFEKTAAEPWDDSRLRAADNRLRELGRQLPCISTGSFSLTDVLAWARLAFIAADHDPSGVIIFQSDHLADADIFETAIANLLAGAIELADRHALAEEAHNG